jgi:hypothetical protein
MTMTGRLSVAVFLLSATPVVQASVAYTASSMALTLTDMPRSACSNARATVLEKQNNHVG